MKDWLINYKYILCIKRGKRKKEIRMGWSRILLDSSSCCCLVFRVLPFFYTGSVRSLPATEGDQIGSKYNFSSSWFFVSPQERDREDQKEIATDLILSLFFPLHLDLRSFSLKTDGQSELVRTEDEGNDGHGPGDQTTSDGDRVTCSPERCLPKVKLIPLFPFPMCAT